MKNFIKEPPFYGHQKETMAEHGHIPPHNSDLVPLLNSEIYDIVAYVFEL